MHGRGSRGLASLIVGLFDGSLTRRDLTSCPRRGSYLREGWASNSGGVRASGRESPPPRGQPRRETEITPCRLGWGDTCPAKGIPR